MKQLSTGIEISSKPPFKQRPCCREGLYRGFTPQLIESFKPIPERDDYYEKQCHRFWIQAESMDYNVVQTENEINFYFSEPKMSVKCMPMRPDKDGNLKDEEEGNEKGRFNKNTPHFKFAQNFTQNYNTLAYNYFPEFLRLKELCKLQYIGRFIHSHYKFLEEASTKRLPTERIREIQGEQEKRLEEQKAKISDQMLAKIKQEIGSYTVNAQLIGEIKRGLTEVVSNVNPNVYFSDQDITNWINSHGKGSSAENRLLDIMLPRSEMISTENELNEQVHKVYEEKKRAYENYLIEVTNDSNWFLLDSCQKWPDNKEEWVSNRFMRIL